VLDTIMMVNILQKHRLEEMGLLALVLKIVGVIFGH